MNKRILISVAAVLIIIVTISTFLDFSKNISGGMVAPIAINIYAVLTALVLILISVAFLRK
jgi:glucan phosphoethanolaminetransferase (alkaline phosphatase superfamily)